MSRITIVGAGQAGLQIALGLQSRGHDVVVVTNRTGEDIRQGRVMSSQCMFHTALQYERDLGLNFWEGACPLVESISLTVSDTAASPGRAIEWAAPLDHCAQSVDQRVKIPGWLEEFERRGGKVVLEEAGVDDLERYAAHSDLVLVAAGKGEVARLFERDPSRSPYETPQRALGLTYVRGMVPRREGSAVCFNIIPGVGEYFAFPAITTTGPCEIMVFEGIPGGPMDCWADVSTPAEHLARSREILGRFLPWEAERCAHLELTDANGILAGRFPPTVRQPVATLSSGAAVLGVADVVVLNDPITGQGSNNASKCAASYLASFLARGDGPFDRTWMQQAFEDYWAIAGPVTRWTNALLAPPPPHVLALHGAAASSPRVARRFANGFDDPRDFEDWFLDPAGAEAYLAEARAAA